MLRKRMIAVYAAVCLLLGAAPAVGLAQEYAPRGKVADMLLTAADDYTPDLERSDIIIGYEDGQLREDQPVTRAESFVMVSRAFGDLPEPVGNDKRLALPDPAFTDVPQWAQKEIDNLAKAGILVGTGDHLLSPDEYVTAEQVELMIRRIFSLKGSNLKDDFYSTVNKALLDTSVIPDGEMSSGGFNDLARKTNQQVAQMIQTITNETHETGSKEQKIADFYRSVLAVHSGKTSDLQLIAPYLEAIQNAKTVQQLFDAQLRIKRETGGSCLIEVAMSADLKDSTKNSMYFASFAPSLSKEQYAAQIGPQQQAYLDYLKTGLMLGGVPEAEAEQQANAFYEMEKALSAKQLDPQDRSNVDKIYHVYTPAQLKELFPAIDIAGLIQGMGYQLPDSLIVNDKGLTETFASFATEDHLELLKTSARLNLLFSLGPILDSGMNDATQAFMEAFYGIQGRKTPEETAAETTQGMMSPYIGRIYAETYFSKQAKNDVESMVREFIDIFEARIEKLDWMSEATKKYAVKKLETMNVKIGYPDKWETPLDEIEIKGPTDGGNSYFENVCAIAIAIQKDNIAKQGKPADRDQWLLSPDTVNACYNAQANEIIFPAAILQAPFYDLNQSREENLGGIGTVIAHEITHAFDNNGAKFDEKGNAANWWTPSDYEKFQALCADVIAFYDGIEAAPGIFNNGTLTLSENIADLGGVACALDAMKHLDNPDYDAFFRNNARIWMMTQPRNYLEMLAQVDVHSINKIRNNRTLSNFAEFQQTYGITESDGMFVAPEERVTIW